MSVNFDINDVEFDVDEVRVDKIEYRFVHGYFRGTQTRFCLLLPEPDHYQGFFLQNLQGGLGGDEYSGIRKLAHRSAFDIGAVFVDCNQGHVGAGYVRGLKEIHPCWLGARVPLQHGWRNN